MSYFINKTDGTAIVVLDGTKDTTSTSLTLLGKLSSNYGENQNENFVRLLENFAYNTSPINPITGQLWYDTTNRTIKVYDLSDDSWNSVGTSIVGNITTNGNLFIGSNQFEIQEYLGAVSFIKKSNSGNIAFYANLSGTFTNVLHINGTTGLITVAGNATNNLGVTTYSYVRNSIDQVIAQVNAAIASNISLVNANISSVNSNLNTLNSNITSGTGSVNAQELSVNGNVVLDNSGAGNTVVNFKTPGGVTILSAAGYSSLSTPVTIQGQWTLGSGATLHANYADLAEYYNSDNEYESGTVVSFGGTAEVTISTNRNDTKVAGVVTTNPAFVMNKELQGTRVCIALQGRIPCKVIGPVQRGDLLTTSDTPGYAIKADLPVLGSIIGKSLEDVDSTTQQIIEISVGRI